MATLSRASRGVLSAFSRACALRPLAQHPGLPTSFVRFASNFPSDRKYKSSHEWVKLDGEVATVGISDHAQSALGEIVFADLPDVGKELAASESAAAIESVKAAAEIYAPVGGEVVAVNEKLQDTPNLINQKPHDDGWMFQLKLSNPSEMDSLMDVDAYTKSLKDSK